MMNAGRPGAAVLSRWHRWWIEWARDSLHKTPRIFSAYIHRSTNDCISLHKSSYCSATNVYYLNHQPSADSIVSCKILGGWLVVVFFLRSHSLAQNVCMCLCRHICVHIIVANLYSGFRNKIGIHSSALRMVLNRFATTIYGMRSFRITPPLQREGKMTSDNNHFITE